MHIESVRQLLELLEKHSPFSMYRGQPRDWPLLPSIGRDPEAVDAYEDWPGFHESIIRDFLRLGHPYLSGKPTKGFEAWVLAQHHGLPTRLLDTSTNPLKALFFAVSDPEHDSVDGVFWIFEYNSWREELPEKSKSYWDKELVPFLPAQLDARLTAQEGAFISYPLPKNTKPLVPIDRLKGHDVELSKYIVPASSKGALRRQLELLGVQYRFLFPDLDGVAKYIKLTTFVP